MPGYISRWEISGLSDPTILSNTTYVRFTANSQGSDPEQNTAHPDGSSLISTKMVKTYSTYPEAVGVLSISLMFQTLKFIFSRLTVRKEKYKGCQLQVSE